MPTYQYGSVSLPLVTQVAAPLPSRAPVGETPGRNGQFGATVRYLGGRTVKIGGVLKASAGESFDSLLSDWAALLGSLHREPTPAKLYTRNGWYYNARLTSAVDVKRSVSHIQYDAEFLVADPYAYADNPGTANATLTGGGTAGTITVAASTGNVAAVVSLTVALSVPTNGAGAVTITDPTGAACTLTVTASATLTVNGQTLTVIDAGGSDQTGLFTGQYPCVPFAGGVFTLATTGAAVITSASAAWRDRSL